MISLLGALTAPAAAQSPNSTGAPTAWVRADILPGAGLTVEEVEPWVYRVIDDGVRDLSLAWPETDNAVGLVVGHDGGIWFALRHRFFRLGSEEEYELPVERPRLYGQAFEVAPDGTVWAVWADERDDELKPRKVYALRSFDGEEWMYHKRGPTDVEVTADGTVWAVWAPKGHHLVVGHLDDEKWQRLDGSRIPDGFVLVDNEGDIEPLYPELLATNAGDIWLTRADVGAGPCALSHFVDGEWQAEGPSLREWPSGADIGPDGTVWARTSKSLVRFDGTNWREWTEAELLGDYERGFPIGSLVVAPDGTVWDVWGYDPNFGLNGDGVAHFDGATWRHYLRDHCIHSMDVDADGNLWLLAKVGDPCDEGTQWGLYVITPEAVTTTE